MKDGFSLLEMLVTLTLIGILAASALPVYTHYLLRSRRTQAKVSLLQLASKLEHYGMTHHTYAGVTITTLGLTPRIANGHYQLTILKSTNTYFQIAAIPQGDQQKDQCGTLIVEQTGKKSSEKLGGSCW